MNHELPGCARCPIEARDRLCQHDSLFLKYSAAPCTVLAAKDRLLGHNPLAAIYTIGSYYRSLKQSTRR